MNDLGLGITLGLKDKFSSKAKGVTKTVNQMKKGADGAVSKFSKLDATLSAAAGAAIFTGAKRALTGVTQPFVSFQEKMFEVHTLVDDSSFSVEDFSKQILKMSKSFGIANVDQAGAAYQLLSSGVADASNAMEVLEVANKISVGGLTTAENAVDVLSTVMNAWKMDTGDAMSAADALFQTVKSGKTDMRQLSGFISQAAPVASALGVSLDELGVAIGTITVQGTPTAVAMTQIRSALVGMVNPTEELQAVWSALGFESATAAIKTLGLQKAMQAMEVATDGDLGAMKKLLGSVEAANAVLQTTGKNASTFNKQLAAMEGKAGATEAAVSKMQKSQAFKNRQLAQSWEAVKIAIGSAVFDSVGPLIKSFSKWLDKAGEWLDQHPRVKKALAVTVVGVAALATAIGVAAVAMATLTFVSWPILLVFAAIVAAVVYAYVAFKVLSKAIDTLTGENDYLVTRMAAGWEWVKNSVSDFILVFKEDVWPTIQATNELIFGSFKTVFKFIGEGLRTIISGMEKFLLATLSVLEVMPGMGDEAKKLKVQVKDMASFLKENPALITPWGLAAGGVGSAFKGVGSAISGRANEIRRQQLEGKLLMDTTGADQVSRLTTDASDQNMSVAPTNIQNIIEVPKSEIKSSDVVIDGKKIGEVIFKLIQTATVRETQTI